MKILFNLIVAFVMVVLPFSGTYTYENNQTGQDICYFFTLVCFVILCCTSVKFRGMVVLLVAAIFAGEALNKKKNKD